MADRGFILVADEQFFPGAVAAVNALRFYGHKEPIHVFDVGLTGPQREALLSSKEVVVGDLDKSRYKLCGPGRAWESKAHALALPLHRYMVYLDSDAFPVSNVSDLFSQAEQGLISGGQDGTGETYGTDYRPYGFPVPFRNDRYFSTSCFSFDRQVWQPVLDRWSGCCDENGGFREDALYRGHGDQGVLNAVVCSTPGGYERINLLDNRLWSCHWTYWSHLPKLLNQQRILLLNKCGRTQRVLHCGGTAKFWQLDHLEMTKRNGPLDAYFCWLKFLSCGPVRPAPSLLPDHLLTHLEKYRSWVEVLGTGQAARHFSAPKRAAVILRNFQAPGDVLMLTAAVRDLKKWYPEFDVDVRTPCPDLWLNNPYLSSLDEGDQSVRVLDVEYGRQPEGLIHQSNQRKDLHFLHAFIEDINYRLGLNVRLSDFKPDVHLTREELARRPLKEDYWIVITGGKGDARTKHPPLGLLQAVVTGLPDVRFVQLGATGRSTVDPNHDHIHPDLRGANVLDFRGKTTLRECLWWVQHAQGVICPVTFFMHAAAALGRRCIILAGGREPWWWEAYPGHDFLHTIGKLSCCGAGGCWRSLLEGDKEKDKDRICLNLEDGVPKCLTLLKPEEIIAAIQRPQKRPAEVELSLAVGTARSTQQDVLAVLLDGRKIQAAAGVLCIRSDDPAAALDVLKWSKFRDAYVFGLVQEGDLGDVHRLVVKLRNLGPVRKLVHFCTDEQPKPGWQEFFRTASLVSVAEGLKQVT